MRYLSLFSGVEACTVAWKPLGWEAAAFCEWDAAPSAVLAHHYPDVPNFGDVSNITADDIRSLGHIDLVVGGSPCQDLSVAGKRAGMDGARSGLFREQMRIFHLCKEIHGTRLLLWENVPGARTSNKGRDFAKVVAEMAGLIDVTTPKYGWGTEGAALGEHGLLEWCTLDAQFFGLAQRRKRIFALLDTGDWTSRPPILLERESLRGDTPPSREAQKETTTNVEAGVGVPDTVLPDTEYLASNGGDIVGTLCARGYKGVGNQFVQEGKVIAERTMVAGIDYENNGFTPDKPMGPLMAGSPTGGGRPLPAVAYAIKATAIGRKPENGGNGLGISEEVSDTLTTVDRHGVGVISMSSGQANATIDNNVCSALTWLHEAPIVTNPPHYAVRRLTPVECCRLQGFPDDYLDVEHRGKPFADGNKYKAMGNSMAVPVMRWIAESIQSALNQPS